MLLAQAERAIIKAGCAPDPVQLGVVWRGFTRVPLGPFGLRAWPQQVPHSPEPRWLSSGQHEYHCHTLLLCQHCCCCCMGNRKRISLFFDFFLLFFSLNVFPCQWLMLCCVSAQHRSWLGCGTGWLSPVQGLHPASQPRKFSAGAWHRYFSGTELPL